MQGFCGLCNELVDVRFRQWFLCPICHNVAASYQKGFVSAASIHHFWTESVAPLAPAFKLVETDVVTLTPFARGKRTKRQAAEALLDADFLASELVDGIAIPRFHIELKAGPGSISEMSEFQLDVNDYNDIVGPVRNTELPAYVFHVQLGMEYFPPTRRSIAREIWWTDIVTLTRHHKHTSRRRDESKAAMYFDPAAFRSKDDFPAEVVHRGFAELSEAIRNTPLRLIGA